MSRDRWRVRVQPRQDGSKQKYTRQGKKWRSKKGHRLTASSDLPSLEPKRFRNRSRRTWILSAFPVKFRPVHENSKLPSPPCMYAPEDSVCVPFSSTCQKQHVDAPRDQLLCSRTDGPSRAARSAKSHQKMERSG
eukprot:2822983-Rhodomonas_salina.1